MDKSILKVSSPNIETVYYIINQGNEIYKIYNKIIDSYVLDFFTCSHWDMLPLSWKTFFNTISHKDLTYFLDVNEKMCSQTIPPLSLICLKNLIGYLTIPRLHFKDSLTINNKVSAFNKIKATSWNEIEENKLMKLFWKNVKVKKRHELSRFAEYTYQTSLKTNCQVVVDVGAGLGHLCRLLCYGYGLRVVGIEAQDKLVDQAKKLNEGFERLASKYDSKFNDKHPYPPSILNMTIKEDVCLQEFLKILQTTLNLSNTDLTFGIVGLHPCGDLGPTLLNLYKTCPNIRFINVVGCCYMKLTSGSSLTSFPHIEHNHFALSYHAREIACHAIEAYVEKLRSEQSWELKIHAYRATLEKILEENFPHLRHKALANVKYTEDMTFSDYCQKALKKLSVRLPPDVFSEEIGECLSRWKCVVTFYTIRLMFAPIIESMIILDRFLSIFQVGHSLIDIVFDPKLSPRNFVVTGLKNSSK